MKLLYKVLNFFLKKIIAVNANINKRYIIDKYNIHASVGIKSTTKIFGNGKIIVGEGSYFGSNSFIVSNPKSATITIGKNCMISHDVHIRTSQYDTKTLHNTGKERKTISANILIGDNVWIGKGVYIKGGVKIGNNVTIGANSVVVKDIKSDMIVGGIPARTIRLR